MEKSKSFTFIGFAIKARKLRCGVNAIATLKKADLLIVCSSASENTKKDAVKLSKKLFAKLLVLNEVLLESVVYKDKCKLVAITDKALAKAIINSGDSRFCEYQEG